MSFIQNREAVDASSLEAFSACLDKAWSTLPQCKASLPMAGGPNWMIFMGPFSPKHLIRALFQWGFFVLFLLMKLRDRISEHQKLQWSCQEKRRSKLSYLKAWVLSFQPEEIRYFYLKASRNIPEQVRCMKTQDESASKWITVVSKKKKVLKKRTCL